MISTLIALPYKVARSPLALIDSALSERLPETSLPRVTLDRVIGSSDKLAGALLGNGDIAERGADRIERSDMLLKAANLEQQAATSRKQAEQEYADGRKEAEEMRKTAEDRASKSIHVGEIAEARGKREATVKAKKEAVAKKAAADKKAASRKATIEQRQQRVESTTKTKKKTAQRQAKAKIDDARKTDKSAARSRADAERLSDLTEVKKQERKQG